VLLGAWAALLAGAAAVAVALLEGGLLLLYVAIGASALSMTLAVAYLLRGSTRKTRGPDASAS
jgi:hypothetical protein